jgi:hypothetical protein
MKVDNKEPKERERCEQNEGYECDMSEDINQKKQLNEVGEILSGCQPKGRRL